MTFLPFSAPYCTGRLSGNFEIDSLLKTKAQLLDVCKDYPKMIRVQYGFGQTTSVNRHTVLRNTKTRRRHYTTGRHPTPFFRCAIIRQRRERALSNISTILDGNRDDTAGMSAAWHEIESLPTCLRRLIRTRGTAAASPRQQSQQELLNCMPQCIKRIRFHDTAAHLSI